MKRCLVRSSFPEAKEWLVDDEVETAGMLHASSLLGLAAVAHHSCLELYSLKDPEIRLVYTKKITEDIITAVHFIPRTTLLACALFSANNNKTNVAVAGESIGNITGRTCIFNVFVKDTLDMHVACHLQRVYHIRGPERSAVLSISSYAAWSGVEDCVLLYHKFKGCRHYACTFTPAGGSWNDDEVEEICAVDKCCTDLSFRVDQIVSVSFKKREVGPVFDQEFRMTAESICIEGRPRSVEFVRPDGFAVALSNNSTEAIGIFQVAWGEIQAVQQVALGSIGKCSLIKSTSKWLGAISLECKLGQGREHKKISSVFWNSTEVNREQHFCQCGWKNAVDGLEFLGSVIVESEDAQTPQILCLTEKEICLLTPTPEEATGIDPFAFNASAGCPGGIEETSSFTRENRQLQSNMERREVPQKAQMCRPKTTIKRHGLFDEVRELKSRLDKTQVEVDAMKEDFTQFTQEVTGFFELLKTELHFTLHPEQQRNER